MIKAQKGLMDNYERRDTEIVRYRVIEEVISVEALLKEKSSLEKKT